MKIVPIVQGDGSLSSEWSLHLSISHFYISS